MPLVSNIEKNVILKLELLNNKFLDIDVNRNDYENWIPFEFDLNINGTKYLYSPEMGATFTLFEVRKLVAKFEEIIRTKKSGTIERFEFSTSERYFDIIISDPLEENQLSVEIWISVGVLTNGEECGFERGFRFDVTFNDFISFASSLRQQLLQLCG